MKRNPVITTPRHRKLACLAGALEVDTTLYTSQSFDWFDRQLSKAVALALYF